MSGPLMPCLETICFFYNDAHFHLIYLSDPFEGVILFTYSSFFLHYLMLMYDGDQLQ